MEKRYSFQKYYKWYKYLRFWRYSKQFSHYVSSLIVMYKNSYLSFLSLKKIYNDSLKIKITLDSNFFYSCSEAGQDIFVICMLDGKKNGAFVEIGSQNPIEINNTYVLEKYFNWEGCMLEYNSKWAPHYDLFRKSKYFIRDATKTDYSELFKSCKFTNVIDYLSLDLEVNNNSTIECLENLPLENYQFRIITFEHDIYRSDNKHTRERSREIFYDYGYELICADVKNKGCAYEDWYVHPKLVDMKRANYFRTDKSQNWQKNIFRIQ